MNIYHPILHITGVKKMFLLKCPEKSSDSSLGRFHKDLSVCELSPGLEFLEKETTVTYTRGLSGQSDCKMSSM